MHRKDGIPVMRMAGVGEILKSAQTGYLRELAGTDSARAMPRISMGRMMRRRALEGSIFLVVIVDARVWLELVFVLSGEVEVAWASAPIDRRMNDWMPSVVHVFRSETDEVQCPASHATNMASHLT